MKHNQFGRPGIPLFFKLWFAFVAMLAICIIVGSGIVAFKIFGAVKDASPDTIRSAIGKAVAAYEKAAK